MGSRPHSHRSETKRRARILDRLLRAERGRLLRQIRFHSERAQDAEDALGDACVQFLRFYDGPAEGRDALRWMLLVSKRCAWAITRQRRQRRANDQRSAASVFVIESVESPAERAERSEEVGRVLAAIKRLVPDERTALILFGMGCSYEEIASLRGWSLAKVNRRLADGRARVRRMLEKEGASL